MISTGEGIGYLLLYDRNLLGPYRSEVFQNCFDSCVQLPEFGSQDPGSESHARLNFRRGLRLVDPLRAFDHEGSD